VSDEPDTIKKLRDLVRERGRFALEAYLFLYQSLEHSQKLVGERRHVSGAELLEGIRALAIEQFGPLTLMVFEAWGLRRTDDVGEMIFDLVDRGLMGKTDEDKPEDFQGVYDFHEVFAPDQLVTEVDVSSIAPPFRVAARELPAAERAGAAT